MKQLDAEGLAMELNVTQTEIGWTVIVSGEIDADNASEFEAGLASVEPQPGGVLRVDAGQLTYLDSSGISALLRTRLSLEAFGGTVQVVNPSPTVDRILEISGLHEVFGLAPRCETEATPAN